MDEILGDLRLNIAKVKEHGDRANRIVDGMLAHSRDEAGQIESINVNLLVEEYTKLAYHGMRGTDSTFNVTITRDFDPEAGRVQGIARDLSRVILNIVTNACQATQSRGRQEGRGYSPTLLVATEGRGDTVCIKVRDNGTGIPESVVRKIFDPFFTPNPVPRAPDWGCPSRTRSCVNTMGSWSWTPKRASSRSSASSSRGRRPHSGYPASSPLPSANGSAGLRY